MTGTTRRRPKRRRRGLSRGEDLALCVVVAVGIIAAVGLLGFYTTADSNSLFKWLGFSVMTALVFVDAIRLNRRSWAQRRFWLVLGAGLGAQCALGIAVLWTVPRVYTMSWAYLIPLDYVALGAFLDFFLPSEEEMAATLGPPLGRARRSRLVRVRRRWRAFRRRLDDFFGEIP